MLVERSYAKEVAIGLALLTAPSLEVASPVQVCAYAHLAAELKKRFF